MGAAKETPYQPRLWDEEQAKRPPATGADLRDAAVQKNEERVAAGTGGTALVARITERLFTTYERFTADDVTTLLDDAGVPRDLHTRRELVSVIVMQGRRAGRWVAEGYVPSLHAHRHYRPVRVWRVMRGPRPVSPTR